MPPETDAYDRGCADAAAAVFETVLARSGDEHVIREATFTTLLWVLPPDRPPMASEVWALIAEEFDRVGVTRA